MRYMITKPLAGIGHSGIQKGAGVGFGFEVIDGLTPSHER